MEKVNHAGKYYGKLYVLKQVEGKASNGSRLYLCLCECGATRIASCHNLVERLRHCGNCGVNQMHGKTGDRTYQTWRNMIRRCYDKKCNDYPRYGGRGIHVCYEWYLFENFLSDMGDRPARMSLDRIDVNGRYSKENCRWATAKKQMNNRTINHYVTANGVKKTIAEWSDETGLGWQVIHGRLKRGWSDKRAVTTPVDTRYARNKQESVK